MTSEVSDVSREKSLTFTDKMKIKASSFSSRESRRFRRSETIWKLPINFLEMITYTIKKCDLRYLDFAQKCPQNAGNGISENQISNIFKPNFKQFQTCPQILGILDRLF